jgi:hypothetical protein
MRVVPVLGNALAGVVDPGGDKTTHVHGTGFTGTGHSSTATPKMISEQAAAEY